MGVYPAVYGIPSDTLAIRQHNLKINEMIINLRQSMGVRVLEVPANARQVFRSLKENRVVIIAADQHASAGTLVMDFFGRPAAVARGPALFAIRRGCPVIPMLIRRERYDRHIVMAGKAVYSPDSGDEDANVRAMTAQYSALPGPVVMDTQSLETTIGCGQPRRRVDVEGISCFPP